MRMALTLGLVVGCAGGAPEFDPSSLALDCTTSGHVCTVAGTGERGWSDDGGQATNTILFLPTDLAFDVDEQPLIVDYNNMRILRTEPDGTAHTIVGMGIHAYASNEVDALETPLENPVSMVVGPDGELYVTEQHGARILRVQDGWLDVYAGSATEPGIEDWAGDGGPALDAAMSQSVGLTIGPDGTLYIGDTGNHRIRTVSPDGIMGTLAGSGERALLDGVGAGASFAGPQHLAWHDGHVYVADTFNHAVRRVHALTGEVETLAGDGTAGFSGDGGPANSAQLDTPQGVAVDADGRVYIADSENHVVRRIDTDGTIATWAGTPGVEGYTGDGDAVGDATLHWPTNVRVGPDGSVYLLDTLNSVVRRVAP